MARKSPQDPSPSKLDPKNPAGTVESRFAGIWEGIVALLKPAAKE